MPHLFRVDRVRGCLLGLAVGDALGAPLEGLSPQQIKTHYGRVTNYVDGVLAWKRKPHRWRMPGLYTDDTQQALALCDVLLDCRRVDQERLADLYLGLMTPKGPFSERTEASAAVFATCSRRSSKECPRTWPVSRRRASGRRCGSPRSLSTSVTRPARCSIR